MNKIIEEVIQRSNERLQFEKGSPFTQEGFEGLKVEIASYINSLITESYKIAKRHKGDLISKSHIESASYNLIKKRSKNRRQIFSSIGGFLFGFAISKTFEVLADSEKFTNSNTILIFACGMIGAFLLGITLFRSEE
jgi:hypothetical protein